MHTAPKNQNHVWVAGEVTSAQGIDRVNETSRAR
jgi:hypothetical protein